MASPLTRGSTPHMINLGVPATGFPAGAGIDLLLGGSERFTQGFPADAGIDLRDSRASTWLLRLPR